MAGLRYGIVALVLAVSTFGLSSEARAVLSGACASDLPGLCTVSVELSGSAVTIILTNTSPAANGGYIVADAFNIGTAQVDASSFAANDADFKLNLQGASVSPYGARDTLISITDAWLGGGSPTSGLGAGQSLKLTFSLTDVGNLSEEGLLGSTLIRFRGFEDGDSDKDTVVRVAMPELGSLPLLVLGLGGLSMLWWRRQAHSSR
jgi:hypothetical protein